MTGNFPDLTYESTAITPVAGIDEAGRGPLAGPVVAAAVILNQSCIPKGLHDSKKLSKAKRSALYDTLQHTATIGVGWASPEEIDAINILQATKLAMQRAFETLPVIPNTALIDGNQPPELSCQVQAIVKGDSKSLSIAAASIIAKVTRDRMMEAYCMQYPAYGFSQHAGYGTKIHMEALAIHGPCPIHRRSFAPVRAAEQMVTAA